MEVSGVTVIYGFQFAGTKCIEGDKYTICGTKLFYKGSKDDLAEKTDFCKALGLRIYIRDDKSYIGFNLTHHRQHGSTALHLFHQRMKNLEVHKAQIQDFLQDVATDCHLDVDEFDFISIPYPVKPKV